MKRLDRLKQWAGEKMGGEIKTTLSDDFKSMEAEMQLRQDGKYRDLTLLFCFSWLTGWCSQAWRSYTAQ